MSQPEMRPGGPPPGEPDETPRGDLTARPFPHGDWGAPAERLDELYRWVEDGALRTVEWYLADRVAKRRGGRVLRLGAAVGGVTGATLPLLELTDTLTGVAGWGYVALLLGAACVLGDRYLGLTSGWMRSLATAQAVQRRLQALQFDWASENVREVLGPAEGTASEAAERCLRVLRVFSEDIAELVRGETAEWAREFGGGPGPGPGQPTGPGPAGGVRGAERSTNGRTTLLPGNGRPSMPRQRPPEPPR
ncbi:SLATT domain-containing protein [Streptomyces sp. NPDC057638]|uniref:SLATT domain-containing protein n=1 Tax=Streptomyces sp. NPDC057638 TaxID=3346190 RepID=UPI003689280C